MFLAQVDTNTWGKKKRNKTKNKPKNPTKKPNQTKIPKQTSPETTLQNTRKIPTLKPQTAGYKAACKDNVIRKE